HAGPAGATIGRLEAHDAAERGGPTDGAAGVRPGGAGHEPGGQRRPGAAAGAAGDVVEVPRIARRLEAMAGELQPERELVGDELAEQDGARVLPAPDAGGVVVRHPVG